MLPKLFQQAVGDALDNVKVNDENFDDDGEMIENEVDDKAAVVTNDDNCGKQEDEVLSLLSPPRVTVFLKSLMPCM